MKRIIILFFLCCTIPLIAQHTDPIQEAMANYDYTHINFRGGKHLAGLLYETMIYGKEQYDRRRAYEKE